MNSSTSPQPQNRDRVRRKLTIGLELEGAVAVLRDGKEDPNPSLRCAALVDSGDPKSDDEHILMVYKNLETIVRATEKSITGFKIKPYLKEHAIAGDELSEKGEFLGKLGLDRIYPLYRDWAIVPDVSGIKENLRFMGGDYRWDAAEIKSKVYTEDEIDELDNHLNQVCDILPREHRWTVKSGLDDRRPGVHIHIGTTHEKGFELQQLKRLVTFMWIYEPAIMKLFPSWKSDYIRYGSLLRKHTDLALWANIVVPMPIDPKKKGTITPDEFKFYPDNSEDARRIREEYEANIPRFLTHSDKIEIRIENGEPLEITALNHLWAAPNVDYLAGLIASRFGLRRGIFSLRKLRRQNTSHFMS